MLQLKQGLWLKLFIKQPFFFGKTEKLGRQLNVMVMLNREVRRTTKCNGDVKLKSIKFIAYIYTDNREIIIVKLYTRKYVLCI